MAVYKSKKVEAEVEEALEQYGQPLNFENVWLMFKETDRKFQETALQMKETDRLLKEQSKETEKKFQETDKRMKKLHELFTSQWGKLIESLVKGDLVPVLNGRGIPVHDTYERRKGIHNGTNYEFDIIASNGKEVVFVEVKTTLRPDDVNHFIKKLHHVKEWLSEYKDNTIYGAVAFLTEDGSSALMSEKGGLFVIRATGNSASIINKKEFIPRGF